MVKTNFQKLKIAIILLLLIPVMGLGTIAITENRKQDVTYKKFTIDYIREIQTAGQELGVGWKVVFYGLASYMFVGVSLGYVVGFIFRLPTDVYVFVNTTAVIIISLMSVIYAVCSLTDVIKKKKKRKRKKINE